MEQGKGAEGAEYKPFTVMAGTIEGDCERNYKYTESFADVMDAVRAWESVKGYHFAEIEYRAATSQSAEPVGFVSRRSLESLASAREADRAPHHHSAPIYAGRTDGDNTMPVYAAPIQSVVDVADVIHMARQRWQGEWSHSPEQIAEHYGESAQQDDCKCHRLGDWDSAHHPLCDANAAVASAQIAHTARQQPMTK